MEGAATVSNMQDLFLMPVIPLLKHHKDGLMACDPVHLA